jgi:cell division septation protein DedD
MTCREFMEIAAELTPTQLLRMTAEDVPAASHAQECAACGHWLGSHRSLDNALSGLRTATAQQQAGPKVEDAVLRAFRAQEFAPSVAMMPERSAPAAWRLSRMFEVGAYTAVAAALVVGLFLGARILRDKQTQPVAQAETTSAPSVSQTATSTPMGSKPLTDRAVQNPVLAMESRTAATGTRLPSQAKPKAEASTNDPAGYVAVMLCDPLICSGDEHVIRMELPATVVADGSNTQPVLADVVIGEDGLVRAMRIVNQ